MVKHTQQFVGKLRRNCFSVFDHFVGWRLKGLDKKSGLDVMIALFF